MHYDIIGYISFRRSEFISVSVSWPGSSLSAYRLGPVTVSRGADEQKNHRRRRRTTTGPMRRARSSSAIRVNPTAIFPEWRRKNNPSAPLLLYFAKFVVFFFFWFFSSRRFFVFFTPRGAKWYTIMLLYSLWTGHSPNYRSALGQNWIFAKTTIPSERSIKTYTYFHSVVRAADSPIRIDRYN